MEYTIGICDDCMEVRNEIREICENFAEKQGIGFHYWEFLNGETVLDYCQSREEGKLDLLFLDIEMDGMNGISVKEALADNAAVFRIAFVTSHEEKVWDAFGKKTIGFLKKPVNCNGIEKMLRIVLKEYEENMEIIIRGYCRESYRVQLEDIVYLKAEGSYTEIVCVGQEKKVPLVCKKLGELEKELNGVSIIRIHKSYLVNLVNVVDVENGVRLLGKEEVLPVGRSYKASVKTAFLSYGRNRMRKRL